MKHNCSYNFSSEQESLIVERNSVQTKQNILNAAIKEFSAKGLAGARIDEIASEAGCNKGMIYQYYGSKDALYETVIRHEYELLAHVEADILHENGDYTRMVSEIVDRYFDFLLKNPNFVRIIMWENLNEARVVRSDKAINEIKSPILNATEIMVESGKRNGIFRDDANAHEVIFSLIIGTFSFFSNKYTIPCIIPIDLGDEKVIETHKQLLKDSIMNYLLKK